MQQRRNRSRRRSSVGPNPVLSALLLVLGVLVVIAAALFIFIQVKLGEINRVKDQMYVDIAEVSQVEEVPEELVEALDWGEAGVATSVDGVVNILVVGQDARKNEQRQRSDTMIIFSINKNSKQLTMISLMRDLYVQVPGYDGRKLNAAYQFGGFDLLNQVLAETFGIVIDYNVEIDFSGFKDIVDALGGVDIELSEDEASYLRGEGRNFVDGIVGRYTNGRTYNVLAGLNHLDGTAALDYARARHVSGDADFGRTQRQRKLIKVIFDDLKSASWLKLYKLYSSVAKNVSTDMNNTQILSIAFSAYTMGVHEINSYRIPADNMYYNADYGNGLDVLVASDWDETRQLIHEYLYSDDGGKEAMRQLEEAHGTQHYE